MDSQTERFVEQVLENWDLFCSTYWSDVKKKQVSDGHLNATQIAARFGCSKSTAYLVLNRAVFLRLERGKSPAVPGSPVVLNPVEA